MPPPIEESEDGDKKKFDSSLKQKDILFWNDLHSANDMLLNLQDIWCRKKVDSSSKQKVDWKHHHPPKNLKKATRSLMKEGRFEFEAESRLESPQPTEESEDGDKLILGGYLVQEEGRFEFEAKDRLEAPPPTKESNDGDKIVLGYLMQEEGRFEFEAEDRLEAPSSIEESEDGDKLLLDRSEFKAEGRLKVPPPTKKSVDGDKRYALESLGYLVQEECQFEFEAECRLEASPLIEEFEDGDKLVLESRFEFEVEGRLEAPLLIEESEDDDKLVLGYMVQEECQFEFEAEGRLDVPPPTEESEDDDKLVLALESPGYLVLDRSSLRGRYALKSPGYLVQEEGQFEFETEGRLDVPLTTEESEDNDKVDLSLKQKVNWKCLHPSKSLKMAKKEGRFEAPPLTEESEDGDKISSAEPICTPWTICPSVDDMPLNLIWLK
ncbi:hypothetical protein TIFTF001_045201 [Ficus carica]|uniref:Uncharacterized protein n=1 Tax=Ficus carica TaxID=3494 RepID=A0AA88CK53_FICCA|nr:hypothetical protein TIFTF001_045201 [Ficus carica]